MATGMFSGRSVLGAQQLQRPAEPYLRQQYPEVYGALGGFMGMAPDEMSGSILDPNTARVRAGAQYGFPVGTALQVAPLAPMLAPAVKAGARALGPTAVGMGERYLQRQGLMPAVVEGESAGLLGGPIKPQAPVSPIGFYSAAEQAALALPRKSGTGDAFLNDLMKGQDVKKDELSWMGLDEYLKGKPNVTRQEVQDYIAGNRVDVQERQLGAAVAEDPVGIAQRKAVFDKYEPQIQALYKDMDSFGYDTPRAVLQSTDNRLRKLQEMRDAEADAFYKIPEPTPTKYDRFQLPGGENYREILLTLPEKAPAMYPNFDLYFQAKFSDYADPSNPLYAMAQKEAKRNWDATGGKIEVDDFSGNKVGLSTGNYTSSHFDQPNILAHMRVNDRIDADGKKMLLIEEVQSDWHQAGREKGYIGNYAKGDVKPYTPERAKAEFGPPNTDLFWYFEVPGNTLQIPKSRFGTQDEAMKYVMTEKKVNPEGVPDAPFKGTWHQLALKRALKYAADNGYDRVGLTTGKQQVERYANEMRQNVDEIVFQTGQKLTDSQANELQLLRNKARDEGLSKLNGTERQRYDNLLNNEGDYVGKNETKIKAFKGSNSTFSGIVKDGKFIDGPAAGKTVEEVLGKSMAKQIAEQRTGTIKGDDLTIGGEGMKAYYDEIYPAFFAKQGKKYNAKTGEIKIKTGNAYAQTKGIPAEQSIRYIDISPEMRGGVKKGQPLFTAAPIGGIGLGAGTQDNEMPDAVRQYMADPRYSDPFADTTR